MPLSNDEVKMNKIIGWVIFLIFVTTVYLMLLQWKKADKVDCGKSPSINAHLVELPDGSKRVYMKYKEAEELREFLTCYDRGRNDEE